MFLAAAKLAMVEALNLTFDDDYEGDYTPRSIDIEYPDREDTWPGLFVQFRPSGPVSWTGLNPDMYSVSGVESFEGVRKGSFTGAYELQILALTSAERDSIWDTIVGVVLAGEMREDTRRFHDTLAQHDLIDLTIQKAQITPVGDVVGIGTPWNPEVLTYESTLKIPAVGEFFMDMGTAEFLQLSDVEVHKNNDLEEPYGEDDGLGGWNTVNQG